MAGIFVGKFVLLLRLGEEAYEKDICFQREVPDTWDFVVTRHMGNMRRFDRFDTFFEFWSVYTYERLHLFSNKGLIRKRFR